MASRGRALAPILLLLAAWVGCSSDSNHRAMPGSAGSGGTAAGGGTGGSAGAGTGGGTGGAAGTGPGGGGASGSGGSMIGGRGGGPEGWTCAPAAFGDGFCDCGCGTRDVDCLLQDTGIGYCDVCNAPGSCSPAACPGRIDPADVTTCRAPAGWTCTPETYGDGKQCDCGCGVRDIDCWNNDVASCDDCLAQGSCANGLCPSSIAPGDNAHCAIPPLWSCAANTYGDGVCNCGCGAVDVDCPDAKAASCQVCDQTSCSPFTCAVDATDNAHCPAPPYTWQCSPRLYRDGSRCDCGCGAIDPDCKSLGVDACDRCDDPGSCSAQACPSFIDASFNGRCDTPTPPAGWTCGAIVYGDGTCDCGCGVPDPDCRTADFAACVRCLNCGGHGTCEGTVLPSDPTQCAPPPNGWTCSAAAFRNLTCDCGCGIPDPACQGIELLYVCGNFPVEGCSGGKKYHIDPSHNALCTVTIPGAWTCDRGFYDDGICDCGCGAVDLDCRTNAVAACEQCNDPGSCSTTACPGTISASDTAHCSN